MLIKPWGAAVLALALSATAALADLPVIKVAALKSGTVNWELSTITQNGLDRANELLVSAA